MAESLPDWPIRSTTLSLPTDIYKCGCKNSSLLSTSTERERESASMATLGFNPTKIRTQTFQSHKLISNIISLSKPTKIPLNLSQFSANSPTTRLFGHSSVSKSSVSAPFEAETVDEEDDPTAELSYLDPEVDPESISEWELDFCSRPILDIRGKKIWELLVCDDSLSLQFTKYFPNNVINSLTLKDAIVSISDELGVPLPDKVRFFRSQMQTIIMKACKELGIKPCLSLLLWLEERYETVYMRHPGFQKGAKPLLALDNPFPMELPENLFGEKWAFVQLPFSVKSAKLDQDQVIYFSSFYATAKISNNANSKTKFVFGASLDLDLLGIEIDGKTMIPGLAVASSRAKPLAGLKHWARFSRYGHTCGKGSAHVGKTLRTCRRAGALFGCKGLNVLFRIPESNRVLSDYFIPFLSSKNILVKDSLFFTFLQLFCLLRTRGFDTKYLTRACLILSVGISTRYVYATYKKTPVTTNEAEAWEAVKKACGGLHFLAIQDDLDSDDCVGFWLLLDLPPPPV
ncbi:hypothetical protein TEA_019644 [Camellia sinensis var. sinensis]|uniref:Uncharacterized protein n=1 Tax=Camellia sinensis var. sinensis TaxID=542762 RepID=A0A4S4EW88_CAMSN|nr:hypothetical protein TEA_019644 [Camellia sinensis var. sinensis]